MLRVRGTFPNVLRSEYYQNVTASELRRKLAKLGCIFVEGTNHTKVKLGSRTSLLPRHPSTEVKRGTLNGIMKQLGIKKL